jgi:tetraacyldisaccharide 4'-kinase
VDLIVMNGPAEHPSLARGAAAARTVLRMSLVAGLAHRVDGAGTAQAVDAFRTGRVHAVAGIGHPARFFRDLEGHGLELIRHPFPDHHPFSPGDLAFADDRPILMTEKDAVRCGALATPRMWYVPVTAHLDESDSAALLDRVCRCVAAAGGRTDAGARRKR